MNNASLEKHATSIMDRALDWTAVERLFMFNPPADWRKGGSGTGVPQSRYCSRVRRTNATQATAALARRLYIGQLLTAQDQVAINGVVDRSFNPPLEVPSGVVAVQMAVQLPDEGNSVEIYY